MAGKLYIIATPIGNLEDISIRATRILQEVDLVFCEDTRVSIKLLSHFGISKTLLSCHDHNEAARAGELAKFASESKSIALISDAGTPLVSDPGHKIVQRAIELGMEIIGIPGASAPLAALVGSGLPCRRFSFEGFLPDKAGDRRNLLEKIKSDERTLIFFVALVDMKRVLAEILEIMGNRRACICRELTKKFEEYIRGNVQDLLAVLDKRELKGEAVLVLAGNENTAVKANEEELRKKLSILLSSGAKLKEASGILARECGWQASDVYALGLDLLKRQEDQDQ